jgi:transposase
MVTVLQAYDQVGDAEAVVAARVDQRWQLVLGCLGADEAPFSQGALVTFRARMIAHDLDQKLLDRTELAKQTGRFGWQALRAALDSSPSLGDPEMRHGRKTRTRLFTGYKRHVLKLVDADLIVGAVVRPANEPAHHALALVEPDVLQHGPLAELQIDRGYLGSARIPVLHTQGVAIRAKAWTNANGGRFPKQAFTIDLPAARVVCPAQYVAPIPVGATTVHFPAAVCQACPQRAACTTATRSGRSVAIHPQEAFLQTLRAQQHQPEGRAHLRQRTTVEHSLARVDQIQCPKARYKGTRKNTLDLRRVAVVANLQRLARLGKAA